MGRVLMQGNSERLWQQQKDVSLACLPQYLTEGLCSVEHHEGDARSWSSVTNDIKNEVFLLLFVSCLHLAFFWQHCLPSPYHSQLNEKNMCL